MTTQELKQQIEKVLGNSIRCLLPSYWWKRLFGLTIDAIEQLPDKKYVDKAVSNVKVVTDSAMSDFSTNAVQNKVIKQYVDNKAGSCVVHFPLLSDTLSDELKQKNAESYKKIVASNYTCDVLIDAILGYYKVVGISKYGSDGITLVTEQYKGVLVQDGNILSFVEQPSTLTFVAAFDMQMNDVTTAQEKSTNISNAQTYYRSIQSGKEYQIDLRVFLRDSSGNFPIKVYPSFIGIAGIYNGVYQSSYGANAMVFAKLDLGDKFGYLTFDLILDPDSGFELVPHVDMHEINILHARFKSGVITSEGLTNLQLMQNRTLYKYAPSVPVALYVTENNELIPARVSRASGFLAVYAGDYTIEFYDDGTVKAH